MAAVVVSRQQNITGHPVHDLKFINIQITNLLVKFLKLCSLYKRNSVGNLKNYSWKMGEIEKQNILRLFPIFTECRVIEKNVTMAKSFLFCIQMSIVCCKQFRLSLA